MDGAKESVQVQAYSFTSAPITKALVDAHKRGVKIQVVLDKSQRTERYSSADFLQHAGIATFIDTKHAIAHNKIIIDGATVITGTFNFTQAAEERNAENLLERPVVGTLPPGEEQGKTRDIRGAAVGLSGDFATPCAHQWISKGERVGGVGRGRDSPSQKARIAPRTIKIWAGSRT